MKDFSRTGLSLAVRSALIGTTVALALHGGQANAASRCYGFDDLSLDETYPVGGGPIETDEATVNVQTFLIGEEPPANPGAELVRVLHSNLPSYTPPSIELGTATLQVIPDVPLHTVTFDYAQSTGLDNRQRQNFGVNGERLTELEGGLEQLDGRVLGRVLFGGPAQVAVVATPDSDTLPTWVRGTVTISALGAGINGFAVGGHGSMLIDNVCLEW